jgi:hypothetical protein
MNSHQTGLNIIRSINLHKISKDQRGELFRAEVIFRTSERRRLIYLASPEYFAEYAKRFIQTGERIVGVCCGTTPSHISAIKAAVKALKPTTSSNMLYGLIY